MTSRAPLVSVLTPTFNQSEFIGECVSSVIAQSYPNWEQIVIDDSSTDTTEDVVRRCTDRRVHFHRQPHAGILALASTYNRALRESRGDLVAILEGDDFWAPEKLDLLVPKFNDPSVVLAYGRAGIVTGAKVTRTTIPDARFARRFGRPALFNDPPGAAARAMLRVGYPFAFPCAVVIRRAALDAIGGFQAVAGLGAMDYPTFLELTLVGDAAAVGLPELLAVHVRHVPDVALAADRALMRRDLADVAPCAEELGVGTLAGAGAGMTIIDGNASGTVISVTASISVSVSGLTIQNGYNPQSGGGIVNGAPEAIVELRDADVVLRGLGVTGRTLLKIDIEGLMRAVGRTSFGPERTAKR